MSAETSISPDGECFCLPESDDSAREFEMLRDRAEEHRRHGREVVAVVGLGFVGAAMAAVVADCSDKDGKASKFVIGVQRPSVRSYWKIPVLNRGVAPLEAEDPELAQMIRRCVVDKRTLVATHTYRALSLADAIIVDVQCDYIKESLGNVRDGRMDMDALLEVVGIIGDNMKPDALVLIETTVPPGTTEFLAHPVLRRKFKERGLSVQPLLAHSYERVMPGRNYVASIRDYWRVCSGVDEKSTKRVVKFLNEVINTDEFPLTVMGRPLESETAKIVENSFRATLLAFMDEWSVFAERTGVDLIKVIKAIKVRPTHDNMMMPGPGIGGYCLPKDGALGMWAYRHILGVGDEELRLTSLAIDINDTRALRAADLTVSALERTGVRAAEAKVLILGAAYREDVGDTRYSGSELIVRRLTELGAEIRVHDPYVRHWWEFERQGEYPASGHSRARFFMNQDKLRQIRISTDLWEAMNGVDAIILAVRHRMYMELVPEEVIANIGSSAVVVDCFGILQDEKIQRYLRLDCEVVGMGRGHIGRIKETLARAGMVKAAPEGSHRNARGVVTVPSG